MARERTKFEKETFWNTAARSVSPVTIEEDKSGKWVKVNNHIKKRCIIIGIPPVNRINGYPKGLNESLMTQLIELSTHGNQLSISHKLIPIAGDESTKMIQTAIFRNEVQQEDSKKSNAKRDERVTNLVDENLKIQRNHNKANFEAIIADNERQFHSSLIITMKSETVEGLNILESDIISILGSENIEYEIPDYAQKETFLSAQPLNQNPDYTKIQMLAPYAAVLLPSRNPNTNTGKSGLFYGYDRFTNKPIMVDLAKLAAQHCICFGPTGSGKTFTMLMLLLRAQAMLNRRIIYVTPKADKTTNHRAVVEYLGDSAELIDIGPFGHNINPMQILYDKSQMKDDINEYIYAYNNHKLILTKFFEVWFQDSGSINMSSFIDYSLNKVYEAAGIYRDIPSTWHNATWPVLNDLIKLWESELKYADPEDKKTIKAVLNKTFSLGEKGSLEYMNRPTDIDLSKQFIVIDLSNTPDMIKDAMNILITGIMSQRFRTDTKTDTILAFDEGRVFLQNPMMSKFLMTSLTQGRSAGIALWIMLLQASDLKVGGVSEEFLTNIFLKIVLGNNMTKDNVKHITEFLNLDSTDVENIISSGVGEGLLILDDLKTPVEFKPTKLEYEIIKGTYLKNEKIEPASELQDLDTRLIDLVMTQGYCLDQWAPNSTLIQGWTRHQVSNVSGAGLKTAWIRDEDLPSNMTIDHFSTTIQIAGTLILAGAKDVQVNHHNDVDVSFVINEDKWGIEYERDRSHTEKELIEKKFRAQNDYGNVMFVCASTFYKKLSAILGEDFVVQRGKSLQNFIDSIL